jgi:hypothetical protein
VNPDTGAGNRNIERDSTVVVVEQVIVADEPTLPQHTVDAGLKYPVDHRFHGPVGDRTGTDLVQNGHQNAADAGDGRLFDGIGCLEIQTPPGRTILEELSVSMSIRYGPAPLRKTSLRMSACPAREAFSRTPCEPREAFLSYYKML